MAVAYTTVTPIVLNFTEGTPTAALAQTGYGLTPVAGAVAFSGVAPSLQYRMPTTIPTGSVGIQGQIIVLGAGKSLFPGPGLLTVAGIAPPRQYRITVPPATVTAKNPVQAVFPFVPIPVGVIITPLPKETLPPTFVLT